MNKKATGACVALIALAVCAGVPATSSASPTLTHPTGTPVSSGTLFKGTLNSATVLWTDTSGSSLFTCTSSTITGEVTQNTGTSVQGKITSASYKGTGAGETCTSSLGNFTVTPQVSKEKPWCLRSTSTTADTWSITGGACPGGARIKITLDFPGIGECEYESSAAGIAGTYSTDIGTNQDAVLTVTEDGFSRIRGGFLCPVSWHWALSYTLETDTPTPEPFYLS